MAKLGEHYVLSFWRNFSGQELIKPQYDTVEIFVIISTGVISELNRMVPAKESSKVCNFLYKIQWEIIRGSRAVVCHPYAISFEIETPTSPSF